VSSDLEKGSVKQSLLTPRKRSNSITLIYNIFGRTNANQKIIGKAISIFDQYLQKSGISFAKDSCIITTIMACLKMSFEHFSVSWPNSQHKNEQFQGIDLEEIQT